MTEGEDTAGQRMLSDARALVGKVKEHARSCEREDLVQVLAGELGRAEDHLVTVVVCGESNRGKSSLVNALLDRPALLPAGARETTSTHVLVRQRRDGEAEQAIAHLAADEQTDLALDELEDWVSESERAAPRRVAAHVEVALDHPILAEGIVLVDTPGVGGLDRAHGALTRAALRMAGAVILVVDAGAPLTSVELGVLREAMSCVGVVVVVLNRVDVHPGWEDVRRDDEQLLAGIVGPNNPVPALVPASTRMKAKADRLAAENHEQDGLSAELRRDSGIVGLQTLLAGWARERSSHLRAANLCGLAQATLNQLTVPDRTVVETADETPEQLTEQLRRAQEQASELDAEARRQRQWLGDEMGLLQRETDAALRSSCSALEREYQSRLADNRLDGLWDDLEAALHRLQDELVVGAATKVEQLCEGLAPFVSDGDPMTGAGGGGLERRAALQLASVEQPGAPGPGLVGQLTRMSPMLGAPIVAVSGPLGVLALPVMGLAALGIGAMVVQHRRSTQRHEATQRLKETLQSVSSQLPPVLARGLQETRRAVEQQLEEGAKREVGLLREQAKQLQAQIAMTRSQRAAAREESHKRLAGHRELGGEVAKLQRAAAEALVRVSA